MDIDWAQGKLQDYLNLCEEIKLHQRSNGGGWDAHCSELNRDAELQLSTVERIVHYAYPNAPHQLMPPGYETADSEQWISRALGALRDRSETDARLQPQSPVLTADQFHSKTWGAAALIWDTGQYASALQLVCYTLSTFIGAKAESRLRDRQLVNIVFSPTIPKRGEIRLHFPGDREDEDWKSRQNGLHLMAQGVFAGIRNIATHDHRGWSEQEALELLAVLSTVARWTDETERIKAPE